MWISKKRLDALEKKVDDLEKQVQSQPLEIIRTLYGQRNIQLTKTNLPHRQKE